MTRSERAWERGDEMEAMEARRQEQAQETKAAQEYAQSAQGRRDARDRKINALYRIRYDSGLSTEEQAELAALESEAAAERRAEEAAFAAEWTREVTMQRQAEWNRRVRSGEITTANADRAQEAQGWQVWALKRAIAMHKLPHGR